MVRGTEKVPRTGSLPAHKPPAEDVLKVLKRDNSGEGIFRDRCPINTKQMRKGRDESSHVSRETGGR